jgi:2-alkyl-3-oxoalkanoate reductase
MKIFLAGATGAIGKRVVPALVRLGHHVTGVARSSQKAAALRSAGADAIEVDLFDPAAVMPAVAGHDIVINLATSIPPSSRALMPGAWRMTNEIRRQVSRNLSDAARQAGVRRYVQESFGPAYPDCGERWIQESTPMAPVRYNRGIADAESAVLAFSAHGREGVTLRFAYFYGADSGFTQDMIRWVRKGWAPAPGRPDGYISSISHDDAAAAVIAALDLPPGTYNVSDDEPVTRREFFESLAARLGVRPPRFAPAWTARLLGSIGEMLARSQRMSNARLRETGMWRPEYPSIREGWGPVLAALPRH